ncbi:MAG: VWA domain-containing protein [Acidimicrobiia bacterium]|nr:VWA domain-containing protein [Acidimicrobiia bacterium]
MRRYFFAVLFMSLAAVVVGARQASPVQAPQQGDAAQQPAVTFRTETNFVEVHAIVTDQTGAFVRGLTRDDFEVYEDGRLQSPTVFSFVDLPIERPFTPVNASAPIDPDVRETRRTFDGRIYVLVLDDLHTNVTRSQHVRDVAQRFIQQYLGVDDLAAVVYTSGRQESGQELTNNRRLLLAAIDRFQGQKLPSAGAEKLAVHLRDAANQDAMRQEGDPVGRTPEGRQRAESTRDPYDQQRAFNVRRALDTIETTSGWLADVQGRRKALLFFSEGFDYDVYQPFQLARESSGVLQEAQEAFSAAQRANVNVYGIDPRGLNGLGEMIQISSRSDYPQLDFGTFRGQFRELLLSQESLISLADETGGLAIVNANDVAGGLGRIVLDNSRYYLLGYYSDSTRWSRNRFMRIEVKVKRPNLEVRARRGFLPPDPRAAARAREADVKAGTTPALKAALSKPVPVGDLPMRVFATPFKGTGDNASVQIAVEIDGSALRFTESGGRFNESLEVSIVAADQRARVQGTERQTFDLRLMPETRERVSRTGVRLLSRLELPPGRYQLHVGAHESTGGAIGTVPFDVEVPDYSRLNFAITGLALTTTSAGAIVTANPDPDYPGDLKTAPTATRVFSRSDVLSYYAEVYESASKAPHAVEFTTEVQNARDGRTAFESGGRTVVQASNRPQTFGFTTDLPLKDLAPGMYLLRVDATSTAGGQTARKDVLFEIR